jgi:hypothetical protein
MNRKKSLSYRIADAVVTTLALAATAALVTPFVVIAVAPFGG